MDKKSTEDFDDASMFMQRYAFVSIITIIAAIVILIVIIMFNKIVI